MEVKYDLLTLKERFEEKFYITPGCWIWIAAIDKIGYGKFCVVRPKRKKSMELAHRISWELYNGDIPDGICVCHTCDVPSCVNPNHLFLGTQQDNINDMLKKHRGNQPKGEAHGMAKLTEKNVLEIRKSSDKNSFLAKKYNVSSETIRSIKLRKKWSHIL